MIYIMEDKSRVQMASPEIFEVWSLQLTIIKAPPLPEMLTKNQIRPVNMKYIRAISPYMLIVKIIIFGCANSAHFLDMALAYFTT